MNLRTLTDLPILPLRFTATARDEVLLPAYGGSSFRGALGASLRGLVCAYPGREQWLGCERLPDCVYPAVFETRAEPGQAGMSGFQDLPRPYVIRTKPGEQRVRPGEPFSWRMTLMGRAIRSVPYVTLAWRCLEESGLGRGRGRFSLQQVESLGLSGERVELLYERAENLLREPQQVTSLADLSDPGGAPGSLGIRFVTPTQIKYQGRPAAAPEFHVLWRSLQLRLSMLRLAHGAGRPELDFGAVIRLAEAVRLTDWDTRADTWERYSSRQGRRVPMQGFTGTARYQGDLAPFLPALRLGTLTGIGDNCTFGQGEFALLS